MRKYTAFIGMVGLFLVITSLPCRAADCSDCTGTVKELCLELNAYERKARTGSLDRATLSRLENAVNPVIQGLKAEGKTDCANMLKSLLQATLAREKPTESPSPQTIERRVVSVLISEIKNKDCVGCLADLGMQMTRTLESLLARYDGVKTTIAEGFLKNENIANHSLSNVDFQKLRQAGASFMITGIFEQNGSNVILELRCWDVHKASQALVGEYQGLVKAYPGMLRDFVENEVESRIAPRR
jgi:hypothetical protein